MNEGVGTHMDAPAHCVPGGKDIAGLSLQELLAPCVVLDVSAKAHENYSLSSQDVKDFEARYGVIGKGSFVMIHTGWDRFWKEPEKYRNHHVFPNISLAAAEELLKREIIGLGVDTLSPDRPEGGFPVHKLILEKELYIVENIANAKSMPPVGGYSLALPMKIKNGTEAPIRLIGLLKKEEILR